MHGVARPYLYLRPANWTRAGLESAKSVNRAVRVESGGAGNGEGNADCARSVARNRSAGARLKVALRRAPALLGHASSRVNRARNEDRYSMQVLDLPSLSEELARTRHMAARSSTTETRRRLLNVSIFDGHGGARVAETLAEHLHDALVGPLPTRQMFFELLARYRDLVGGTYWQHVSANAESFYDRFIQNCNTKQELVLYGSGSRMIFDKWGNVIDKTSLLTEQQRLRIYYTYLRFDLEQCCGFANQDATLTFEERVRKFNAGSTASSVFLSAYDESNLEDESFLMSSQGLMKLVVTQVGDTNIIICDKNGIAHKLTRPHHLESVRESERLKFNDQGDTDSFGEARFLNNYTNTRSFGDLIAKRDGLSSEPDIYSYLIGDTKALPHSEISKLQFGGDECFVCLVTDGVTDLLEDQEIADLITSTVNNNAAKKATPQYVAEEVVRFVEVIGSSHADNATCIVIRLPNWGNWPMLDRTGADREEKLMTMSSLDKTR